MNAITVDTNVVLDALLKRGDFAEPARQVLAHIETRSLRALLCATSLTTIDYYPTQEFGGRASRHAISQLLLLFEVATVSRATIDAALASPVEDFEDAVIAHASAQAGATAIVTRNLRDFTKSPVRAYTPEQWLAIAQF